jgi:hypothetical protein
MQPYLDRRQVRDTLGEGPYPGNPVVGPKDEVDGSLMPDVSEERKGFEVFLDVLASHAFDFDDGVIVLAGTRLMHEQVWLGFAGIHLLKVRVGTVIHFPVQVVRGTVRPPQSHLMVELVAVHPLSVYRIGSVDGQAMSLSPMIAASKDA